MSALTMSMFPHHREQRKIHAKLAEQRLENEDLRNEMRSMREKYDGCGKYGSM